MVFKHRQLIKEPLSGDEVADIISIAEECNGSLQAVVLVSLNDIIYYNIEGFNDLLEYKIIGSKAFTLSDIQYKAVGVDVDGSIAIQVTAAVERI